MAVSYFAAVLVAGVVVAGAAIAAGDSKTMLFSVADRASGAVAAPGVPGWPDVCFGVIVHPVTRTARFNFSTVLKKLLRLKYVPSTVIATGICASGVAAELAGPAAVVVEVLVADDEAASGGATRV